MAARIILDIMKAAPKILRFARRFGDKAAEKKFSGTYLRAAKDAAKKEQVMLDRSRNLRSAYGYDKKTIKREHKRLFNEESMYPSQDVFKVEKALKTEGKKKVLTGKRIVPKKDGGFMNMKDYIKDLL
jgi:hypothetical protein